MDAAIATNAALAVVAANSCGIGGDAFWLGWDEDTRTQWALNGTGRSAARADAEAWRRDGLEAVPFRGPLSITVPGAVRSWGDAHARFGRLSRAEILAPAIELADRGFPAWDGWVTSVERTHPLVEAAVGPEAPFMALFRPHGRAWRPGERVRLSRLADTLRRLASVGWDDFYDGEIGEWQARALAAAGSPISHDDLRAHRSTWTEPISTTYRGVRVTSHRPNSSGLVALELLNILEHFEPPAPSRFRADAVDDAAWIHVGIEAAKITMGDRNRWLSDSELVEIPVDRLLDKEYAREQGARIDVRHASEAAPSSAPPGGGTVYLAVVDAEGNAVSLIESNWSGFGSGVADPDTGIHYQNRGAFFSLDPDHANVLAPRKRTLHTLLPGMLFRDGAERPWIVAGSMGGDIQPQIHAQFVSAVVDGRLDIRSGVGGARWGVEPERVLQPPTLVRAEPRFPAAVLAELEARGHRLAVTEPFDPGLGHCHAIELLDGGPAVEGGSVSGATDPRSAGLPAAW